MYVEIDLKIKDHLGLPREFSKGLLSISDPTDCASMVSKVETKSLATRLSTVDMTYAVVNRAVEGFIAVEVLQGGFHGKITAYTTSVKDMCFMTAKRLMLRLLMIAEISSSLCGLSYLSMLRIS
jgi:hypothetical protein